MMSFCFQNHFIEMLSTRLLCNLGYRSCSTFSSVLTIGKKFPLSNAKSDQPVEPDQDVPNYGMNKTKQHVQQIDLPKGPDGWSGGLSGSVRQSTYAASDESRDADIARRYQRDRADHWRTDAGWREQGSFNRAGRDQFKQHRSWRRNKSKWDEHDSGKSGSVSTSWTQSGDAWDSDESQWRTLSKPSKKSAGQNNRPSHVVHWDQSHNSLQHKKRYQGEPSQNTAYRSPDKSRGKRSRKKEKLGFIEYEPASVAADTEQLLYGLHPVSLALTAGRRQILRVYHRADAAPSSTGRLSRLLTECAARGVSTVPLPAAQLDRIASGTGVHQGVCARVTPLRPRPIDELLAQAGCPPLTGDPPPAAAAKGDDQKTAAPSFWSVEVGVMGSEEESKTLGEKDAKRQAPVSAESEAEGRQDTLPSDGVTADPGKWTEAGPAGVTPVSERPAHRRRVWLLLDRVQDPMNFGSIIRSSYFLGVDAIIIPDKDRSVTDSTYLIVAC